MIVETDGYIQHVNFPVVLNCIPLIPRQATSSPAVLPVPRSKSKDLENYNYIAEVILLLAEFTCEGRISSDPTLNLN